MSEPEPSITARLTRRHVLVRAGAFSLATAAAPLLAACGSDDDAGGSAATVDDAPSNPYAERLRAALDLPTGEAAGQGKTITLGAALALSGTGSSYGIEGQRGLELAAAHIRALGGPTFEFDVRDHKSGDAQAAAQAGRTWGLDRRPVVIASYQAVHGALLPAVEQYKMLCLDGSGGASGELMGRPYFYGTRADPNTAPMPGLMRFLAEERDVKRLSYVWAETGAPARKATLPLLDQYSAEFGLEVTGRHPTELANPDFSQVIARLKQERPDAVLHRIYGSIAGHFAKQVRAAGLDIEIVGSDYLLEAAKIAGPAYEEVLFGFDYFNADLVGNEFGKIYADAYQAEHKQPPDIYSANNYESLFMVWDLVRRIIADGGDLESGEAYLKALEADPSFASVHGASGKAGTLQLDTKTHIPSQRQMGVYQAHVDKPQLVATFDVGGANFEVV